MRSSAAIAVLAAGAIALALLAGLRERASAQPTAPGPAARGPRVTVLPDGVEPPVAPPESRPPPAPSTAPPPSASPTGQRPTREQLVDAQRKVGQRFADAIQVDAAVSPRFVDDYMTYATAIIDTDPTLPRDSLAKIIDQRCTEFEARVATYITAEQLAALRQRMHRR